MNAGASIDALRRALSEIQRLGSASALLAWDQETMMPDRGIDARAEILSTLAGVCHERTISPELGDLLDQARDALGDGGDPWERALLREVRRDRDRSLKVPTDLVRTLAEAQSKAQAAWQRARKEQDYRAFQPHLDRLLELKREVAEAIGYQGVALDALLDDYEQGCTVAFLETLFDELKDALIPLVAATRDCGRVIDTGPLQRAYPADRQRSFAKLVARLMGFDFEAGRIDRSTHPFCTRIHVGDTRLTWRHDDHDLRPALFGIIHEAGHGLYEQGLPAAWAGTPLGDATSLGVHESQSRLWENMVARGRPFWRHFLPRLKEGFPGLVDDVDLDAMYAAVNEVQPSFIRVEADELTYNLHIVLRFEIERDLFSGALSTDDLPAAWDDGMERLLGIRPAHDADGVLQDVHWSFGAFGYFPTYTLGNLYAAQLFEAARRDLGDLDSAIGNGELGPLRAWLGERIHAKGRLLAPRDLIEDATGAPPSQEAFVRYVTAKFGEVYGL